MPCSCRLSLSGLHVPASATSSAEHQNAALITPCLTAPHLAVLHARLHFDLQDFPFPLDFDIVALLTLLGGVLLVHSRTQLACDHLVLAAALPLPLGRLDHVLVTRDLQGMLSGFSVLALDMGPVLYNCC